jgi:DNA-binding MarR family transcriptional regulator
MDDNEYNSLESLLYGMQFRKLIEKEMEPIQKEYNLCRIDIHILLYLNKHQNEKDTSKDILNLQMFTKGHISQSLTRLQKMGYVFMKQDIEDRRYTHNYLTDAAKSIINKIKSRYSEIWEIIMQDVSDEEKTVLRNIALKVSKNISGFLTR